MMGRPRSHLVHALREIAVARGDASATSRDLAAELAGRGLIDLAARAEVRLVRKTAENMACRGELRRVGTVAVPGSRRPMVAYVAGAGQAEPVQGDLVLELAGVMQSWCGGPGQALRTSLPTVPTPGA